MDTKSKNIHEDDRSRTFLRNFFRHRAVKAAAFLLFVACVTGFAVTGFYFDREWTVGGTPADYLTGRTFEESEFLSQKANSRLHDVLSTAGWYASSQADSNWSYQHFQNQPDGVLYYVRTPYRTVTNNTLGPEEYKEYMAWRLYSPDRDNQAPYPYYRWGWWNHSPPGYTHSIPEPLQPDHNDYGGYNEEYDEAWREYEDAMEKYWAGDGAYYAQYEFRFALTGGYAASLAEEYADGERIFWKYAVRLAALALISLFCLLYLLIVCGRKPASGGTHLSFWDKPWLDVTLGVTVFCAVMVFLGVDQMYRHNSSDAVFGRFISFAAPAVAGFAAAALWWLLSAVKRLKDRSFLRHNLIYIVFARFFCAVWRFTGRPAARFFRAVYNNLPLAAQIGACSVIYGAVVFALALSAGFAQEELLAVIAILFGIAATVYFIWKAIHLSEVVKGLSRLAKGDYSTPVPENGRGILKEMAQSVNSATDGLKAAVEKELTSQRFKSELITNVSHDLRTPLTSVITYADLLRSEGFASPDADKYLEIIRNKAGRLQTLTEDLFEAAKASSGETRAVLAPLDAGQLIEQTLGEMGDRLSAAKLEVLLSGSCGMPMADGRLLFRVFENLLRNIEKYAMTGTRVYIDKAVHSGEAVITLRNISAAPLAARFTSGAGEAERLSERFTRGDEARSTEGSGLGLAIVKSFMELQKGSCAITVDGDLFKVTLTLPLA